MKALGVFALGLVLSLLGSCWLVWSRSLRKRFLIEPAEDRWHQSATQGLGGVPIFIACIIAALTSGSLRSGVALFILAGAVFIFIVGVVDDLRPLTTKTKLAGQSLAAFLVVGVGYTSFADLGILWYHPVAGLIWIVAIINGLNLLDNMDGLAGGITLIATVAIAWISMAAGMHDFGLFYLAVAGSVAGYLILNVYPAKLFMGDAGSLWLGLVLGAGSLVLMAQAKSPIAGSPLVWVIPVLICCTPIMDTLMVMVTRTLRGQSIAQGGRDHLSHRLVGIGLSQKASVCILWLVGLASALIALAVINVSAVIWIPMLLCFFTGAIVFVCRIGKLPVENQC